jgi:hypothetical protein
MFSGDGILTSRLHICGAMMIHMTQHKAQVPTNNPPLSHPPQSLYDPHRNPDQEA